MRKIKSILLCCFCFALLLTTITQVYALAEDDIIKKELEIATIAGDGSAERPYIVDYEKAPHFKRYMERIEQKVCYALQGGQAETGIRPYGVLDNVLIGTAHRSQTNGGSWKYTHDAPTTSSNGNIWMKGITYQSIADTAQTYNKMKNENEWNAFKGIVEDVLSLPYDKALQTIITKGATSASAKAILRALGKANSVFTVVVATEFLHKLFIQTKYKNATNAGDGMLHAEYNTSYNGSWYNHKLEEAWTTANTVYEPANYYGKGIYTPAN